MNKNLSIRERIGNFFLRDEKRKINNIIELAGDFINAYRVPYLSPEALIQQLSEVDSQYIDLIIRQLMFSDNSAFAETGEQARLATVQFSRTMYANDPLVESSVDIWTDFGFGISVDISPRDEQGKIDFDECFYAVRNNYVFGQRYIQKLSKDIGVDGDFLLVDFVSKVDGKSTFRVVPTDEVQGGINGNGIIYNPQDKSVPWFYRRQFKQSDGSVDTMYYRDWRVDVMENNADKITIGKQYNKEFLALRDKLKDEGGKFADEHSEGTDVVAMLVAHRPRTDLRGWPLMTSGMPWAMAYKNFLQDRASVARAAAIYIDKLKIKGNQRTVDVIRSRLESALAQSGYSDTNPPPAAGATWVENESIERTKFDLGTGAGDAEKDGAMLIAQVGSAARIYPHWYGRGESFRLATATSMEVPAYKAFNRYQLFWASVWQDIVTIVLTYRALYGKKTYETMEADISSDLIITADIDKVTNAMQATVNNYRAGLMGDVLAVNTITELNRIALQSFGVKNIDDLEEPQDDQEYPGDEEPVDEPEPNPFVPGEEPEEEPEQQEAERRAIRDYADRIGELWRSLDQGRIG